MFRNFKHHRNVVIRTYCCKSKSEWKPVVGLEIHAQIQSKSKLFSGAGTSFQSLTNNSVSLFDAAIPGTLPVLNSRCVEAGVLTAMALDSDLNPVSHFDRKHYFYADMPAGYQITQQRSPLARNGAINFIVYTEGKDRRLYHKTSRVHQIQLEQDSGRSLHDTDRSLVDLNRAGLPLMELVFEPDLCDGEEAASLVKELCLILTRLGTCSCKMEEGTLRVDANVSVHRDGSPLGTRTEVKNIASTRAIASAIQYEINRQVSLLEKGEIIVNETRAWDALRGVTVPMRDKEEKQDYRYMPEPNLPPLRLRMSSTKPPHSNMTDVEHLRATIPELPHESRKRLENDYGVSLKHSWIIVSREELFSLFTEVMKHNEKRNVKILVDLLMNQVLTVFYQSNETRIVSSKALGELLDLLEDEHINKSVAEKVLQELLADDSRSPAQIIEEKKWKIITDPHEIHHICQDILDKNSDLVEVHRSGKKDLAKVLEKKVWQQVSGQINMKSVKSWFRNNLPFNKKL